MASIHLREETAAEIANESRFAEIVGILAACSFLSTLAVGLRIYCRGFLLRSFGIDDATMVVAQVS
jgi:hypothetical protein